MSSQELKKLSPFRDDEAYIAEKQVDLLRDKLKQVNLKDIFYVKIGNSIFAAGGYFMLFSIIFGKMELTVISGTATALFLLLPLIASWLFKPSRVWLTVRRKIRLATRIAAFGEAYRSRYNLKLSQRDWGDMKRIGVVSSFDVDGNLYHVLADMDYTGNNYVIIHRVDGSV